MPRGVIYGGLAVPADTFKTFCGSGCVASLAPSSKTLVAENLVFVMPLFPDTTSFDVENFAFPLGLTLGRLRTGCMGMPGDEMKYPYADGRIGVVGYDRIAKKLHPASEFDILTFCSPKWISDFSFAATFKRLGAINAL